VQAACFDHAAMLTKIYIHGFKSFHHFEMEFAPFTLIAGANGSGKSNLFDALDLLAHLADGTLREAFLSQRGEPHEMFTKYGEDHFAEEMQFKVEMLVDRKVKDVWGGTATLKYTRLGYSIKIKRQTNASGFEDLLVVEEKLDKIKVDDDQWMKRMSKKDQTYWRPGVTGARTSALITTIDREGIPTVIVAQDGKQGNPRNIPLIRATRSVLSDFSTADFPHILAAKEEMKSWRFLQLNPDDLREPTRKSIGEDFLGKTGKNLAAVLNRIKQQDPYALVVIARKLNQLLPSFVEVEVEDDLQNKQYTIHLKEVDGKRYSSRVLSEGTLRILALCILGEDDRHTGLLCFEEPENGIHPFRIHAITKLLVDLSVNFVDHEQPLRQVIVNTHSPAVLAEAVNYMQSSKVEIHYADIHTVITDLPTQKENEQARKAIQITRIVPVKAQTALDLGSTASVADQKITLRTVTKYLSSDSENKALQTLQS
jgi:predicted ATPase